MKLHNQWQKLGININNVMQIPTEPSNREYFPPTLLITYQLLFCGRIKCSSQQYNGHQHNEPRFVISDSYTPREGSIKRAAIHRHFPLPLTSSRIRPSIGYKFTLKSSCLLFHNHKNAKVRWLTLTGILMHTCSTSILGHAIEACLCYAMIVRALAFEVCNTGRYFPSWRVYCTLNVDRNKSSSLSCAQAGNAMLT